MYEVKKCIRDGWMNKEKTSDIGVDVGEEG
jgi:hypothetical protein